MLDLAPADSASAVDSYLERLRCLLSQVPSDRLTAAVDLLLEARQRARRVYVMGNGGSASTAAHFVCDFQKTATIPGQVPLRAYALTDNTALVTAWANDSTYENIFAGQIAALVEPGDVVVAISASGNSPNIIAGLTAATLKGARTIALVGFDGGTAGQIADVTIHIPCHDYGLVEDVHSALGHAMTTAIRQAVACSTRE
ncbi:MAG: SIS domain-containing protein [Chloroflexi bacterium]|nr:SIS domain-containing protein [Chloroflexota bacterium]